jgi:hypothetical protein
MAETSWPSPDNGRTVNDRQYEIIMAQTTDDGLLSDDTGVNLDPGGIAPVYGDSSGMQVKIPANIYGQVRGFGWGSGTSILTRAIAANASGSTRLDRIVLELNKTTWNVRLATVQGTPGGGLPALTRSVTDTGVFQVHLAAVTVASGASTISAASVNANGDRIGTKVRAYKAQDDAEMPRLGGIWFDEDTETWSGWDGTNVRSINAPVDNPDPNGNVVNDAVTTTSTSYTENGTGGSQAQLTTQFVAGPEGACNIRVYAGLWSSSSGKATRLGARVYDDVAGGLNIWDAADHDAAHNYGTANATCASEMIVRSLVPGRSYTVKLTYKVDSGNTGTYHNRRVYVNPW